jgi:hypothetical protein
VRRLVIGAWGVNDSLPTPVGLRTHFLPFSYSVITIQDRIVNISFSILSGFPTDLTKGAENLFSPAERI